MNASPRAYADNAGEIRPWPFRAVAAYCMRVTPATRIPVVATNRCAPPLTYHTAHTDAGRLHTAAALLATGDMACDDKRQLVRNAA